MPKIPIKMVGVTNLATFSQRPRLETRLASWLLAGNSRISLAIAWPSAEAEYWTKAPRIPEASKIPLAARDVYNPRSLMSSTSPTVVISRKVGANWEIIS